MQRLGRSERSNPFIFEGRLMSSRYQDVVGAAIVLAMIIGAVYAVIFIWISA